MTSGRRPISVPKRDEPTASTAKPWYKQLWVIAVGSSSIAFAVGLNGANWLQGIRKIPAEVELTRDQFVGWLKDDAGWSGDWSSFPEGIVNMGDLRLTSGIDLQISLQAKNGQLGGVIASRKVCAEIPAFDFLLLRGQVSGSTATVEVWDVIGGESRVFERISLVRDHGVITVIPENGAKSWFPLNARIGKHPQTDEEFMTGFCKRAAPTPTKDETRKARKMPSELKYSRS